MVFGNDPNVHPRKLSPERNSDFTGASFQRRTDFRGAVFVGPPAFFEASLYEDTDFGRVEWRDRRTKGFGLDYAIRAWERLELLMSNLEKPLDRHRFFRLKMRARRRREGRFLGVLNWLFEQTADYGWGVGRACGVWLSHWLGCGAILYGSIEAAGGEGERWQWVVAAVGTSFANAHAFLGLAADGGYLANCRAFVEAHDGLGLVSAIGLLQAVLGPMLLFLVLLSVRNRFRLG